MYVLNSIIRVYVACLPCRDVTLTSEMLEVECEDGSMVTPLSTSFIVSSGLLLHALPPYVSLYTIHTYDSGGI